MPEEQQSNMPTVDELLQENAQLKQALYALHMSREEVRKQSAHREWSLTTLLLGVLYGIIYLILQLKAQS